MSNSTQSVSSFEHLNELVSLGLFSAAQRGELKYARLDSAHSIYLGALAAACQDHQENQQTLRREGILRVLLSICNNDSSTERMRDKATAIMIAIVGHPDNSEQ